MTVKELIEKLEQIEDKDLQVVADMELDFCDRLHAAPIDDVYETVEYFGQAEQNGWVRKDRKCVKLYI